jgi:hypothetical protein
MMGWPFIAIDKSGMQCIYCGAVEPDSEDICPNTGGRHTMMSFTDKQGQGQGQDKGPTENNYKDDTHDPTDDNQLKASAAKIGRWVAAWGNSSEGRIGPRTRIHAVDSENPDVTACGKTHAGVIDSGMVFGGEIVGHDLHGPGPARVLPDASEPPGHAPGHQW